MKLESTDAEAPARRAALVVGVLWCAARITLAPNPYDVSWAHALLLLAPAVILPLLHGLWMQHFGTATSRWFPRGRGLCAWWAVAILTLVASEAFDPGPLAIAAALPWAGLVAVYGLEVVLVAARSRRIPVLPATWCAAAAALLGVIGVAWLIFDHAGIRPLDLHSEIVLLTAIHFHFAGMALPLVTAQCLGDRRDPAAWGTALLVTGGVPSVAVGITATQLGAPPIVEALAAWSMAVGALVVAFQLLLAGRRARGFESSLAWIASISLCFGMTLACLYAARHWLKLDWLDIQWMRGVHGSSNAIGFGVCAAVSVALQRRTRAPLR